MCWHLCAEFVFISVGARPLSGSVCFLDLQSRYSILLFNVMLFSFFLFVFLNNLRNIPKLLTIFIVRVTCHNLTAAIR